MAGTRRWRRLVAGVAMSAMAGCGGDGGDASLPDQDADVDRLQPGDRPVRFRLDTAVSDEVRRFTVETLGWAHVDLGDSGPLTVHVYSDENHFVAAYTAEFGIAPADARRQLAEGQTVFASPGGHIWIYLTNYEQAPEGLRRHALFHEYAHTAQDWQAEIRFQSEAPDERSFVPRWLVEGCAEYVAVQAGARRGFVDQGEERALAVARARRSDAPLEAIERGGQAGFLGGEGEAYTLGWLGCERLALRSGPDAVMHRFWLAMAERRDWRQAFADAFGQTPDAFYDDFRTFRATM